MTTWWCRFIAHIKRQKLAPLGFSGKYLLNTVMPAASQGNLLEKNGLPTLYIYLKTIQLKYSSSVALHRRIMFAEISCQRQNRPKPEWPLWSFDQTAGRLSMSACQIVKLIVTITVLWRMQFTLHCLKFPCISFSLRAEQATDQSKRSTGAVHR